MTDRIIQATCHTVEFAEIEAKLREWPEIEAVGSFREKKNNKGDTTKVFITFDSENSAHNCLSKLCEINGLKLSKTSNSNNSSKNNNNTNNNEDNSDSNKGNNNFNNYSIEKAEKSNDTIKTRKGVDVSTELLHLKTRHETGRNVQRNVKSKLVEFGYEKNGKVIHDHNNKQEKGKRSTLDKTENFNQDSVTIVYNARNKTHAIHDERANNKLRRRQNYVRDGRNKTVDANKKNVGLSKTAYPANASCAMNAVPTHIPSATPPPQPFPFPPIPDVNFAEMPNHAMMPPPFPIPPSIPFDPFITMPQPFPFPFPPVPQFQPSPPPPPSELPPPVQVPYTPAPAPFEASVAFVDNVPFGTTNEQLMKLFTPYGSVVDINRLETMAMICYSNPESVQECIQHLNGSKIHNNIITVSSGTIRIPARVAAHIGI